MKRDDYAQRRGRRHSPSGGRPWQGLLVALFMLATIGVVLLEVGKRFPLDTLIFLAVLALAAIGVGLYLGELVVLGWIMDSLAWIASLGMRPKQVPLQYEQVGEMIIVKLTDNIVTLAQCRWVQKQLKCLIDEHHCDFILDFSCAGRVFIGFRGVMIRIAKAARREAESMGKPYHPIALPPGDVFSVFDDRESAVAEMSRHGGHGWLVLCSVPIGIRAVSEVM